MRFCPFCGGENQDDAQSCGVCGRSLPAPVVRRPTTAAAVTPVPGPLPQPPQPQPQPQPPQPQQAAPAPAPAPQEPPLRRKSTSIPPPVPPEARAPSNTPRPARNSTPPPARQASPAGAVPPEARVGGGVVASAGGNGQGEPSARVADGTPMLAAPGLPPPPRSATATPSLAIKTPTPIGRDPTDSALATKRVSLPEVEAARQSLSPMPAVPDGGLIESARYALQFLIARWQRRNVIATISTDVTRETESLDGVLGELGRAARAARLEGRVYADENNGLDEAERRRAFAEQAVGELEAKKGEEGAKFETVQKELEERLATREQEAKTAAAELERVEAQRRGLRDKKRDLEKKQRAILKSAHDREDAAAKEPMGDVRQGMRETAADLRNESKRLDVEKEELDARLAGLEKPHADAAARHEAARAELEAARKDLQNAREGNRHRSAEMEAEAARRAKELVQADAEITRRLVTLGTIVNLNRVALPEFSALYERADDLRAKIATREQEIDRLKAERESFDRPSLIRGGAVLLAALVMLVTTIWIVIAIAV